MFSISTHTDFVWQEIDSKTDECINVLRSILSCFTLDTKN